MTNILIYSGLGILLLGSIFGIFVALKGYRNDARSDIKGMSSTGFFQQHKISPEMKKLTRVWGCIMISGFILLGIGISIGLK
ncbi:MAG: hypothetical protein HFJ95_04440 [Muribaculaceae bacterium]|nr:hypothetical protein [Muribaculaceae bacterium]